MPSVSRTLWSVMSTPMLRDTRWRMMRWMSSTEIGSTPANGSSSRMKRGSAASARDLDAPPLATGQAHADALADVADVQLLEQRLERGLALRVVELGAGLEDRHDVVLYRQLAEHRRFLRQVSDAELRTPIHRQPRKLLIVEPYAARVARYQPDDHVEGGGL